MKKIILTIVCLLFSITNVYGTEGGSNSGSGGNSGGNSQTPGSSSGSTVATKCSEGPSYSTEYSTSYRISGVRITLVDKKGDQVDGTVSADFIYNSSWLKCNGNCINLNKYDLNINDKTVLSETETKINCDEEVYLRVYTSSKDIAQQKCNNFTPGSTQDNGKGIYLTRCAVEVNESADSEGRFSYVYYKSTTSYKTTFPNSKAYSGSLYFNGNSYKSSNSTQTKNLKIEKYYWKDIGDFMNGGSSLSEFLGSNLYDGTSASDDRMNKIIKGALNYSNFDITDKTTYENYYLEVEPLIYIRFYNKNHSYYGTITEVIKKAKEIELENNITYAEKTLKNYLFSLYVNKSGGPSSVEPINDYNYSSLTYKNNYLINKAYGVGHFWLSDVLEKACVYNLEINTTDDCINRTSGSVKDIVSNSNSNKWECLFKSKTTYGNDYYYDEEISNDYCEVYCYEEIDYKFPSKITYNSKTDEGGFYAGTHFVIGANSKTNSIGTVQIKGTKYCGIKIDYTKFSNDIKKYSDLIQKEYDKYAVAANNDKNVSSLINENSIARAGFIMSLYILDKDKTIGTSEIKNFTDVKSTDIYYDALNWATSNKITFGYNNGTFNPNGNLTREQLLLILYRYTVNYKNEDVVYATEEETKSHFKDYNKINNDILKKAIRWSYKNGLLVENVKNNLYYIDGDNKLTKAQLVLFMERYYKILNKNNKDYWNQTFEEMLAEQSGNTSNSSTITSNISNYNSEINSIVKQINQCSNWSKEGNYYSELSPELKLVIDHGEYNIKYSKTRDIDLDYTENIETNNYSTVTQEKISYTNCIKGLGCYNSNITYNKSTYSNDLSAYITITKTLNYKIPDNTYNYACKDGFSYNNKPNNIECSTISYGNIPIPFDISGTVNYTLNFTNGFGYSQRFYPYLMNSYTTNTSINAAKKFNLSSTLVLLKNYFINESKRKDLFTELAKYETIDVNNQNSKTSQLKAKITEYGCSISGSTFTCPNNDYEDLYNSLTAISNIAGKFDKTYKCSFYVKGHTVEPEKIVYRSISLTDPFPGEEGNGRKSGTNWSDASIVKSVITDAGYTIYNDTPLYEFTLTPSNIMNIRSYNDETEYSDFTLNCKDDGKNCRSTFLDNGLEKNYFKTSSGTNMEGRN